MYTCLPKLHSSSVRSSIECSAIDSPHSYPDTYLVIYSGICTLAELEFSGAQIRESSSICFLPFHIYFFLGDCPHQVTQSHFCFRDFRICVLLDCSSSPNLCASFILCTINAIKSLFHTKVLICVLVASYIKFSFQTV